MICEIYVNTLSSCVIGLCSRTSTPLVVVIVSMVSSMKDPCGFGSYTGLGIFFLVLSGIRRRPVKPESGVPQSSSKRDKL